MSDEEVPPQHRLSFLIGEVARSDVSAETEMRGLWWHLRDAGLGTDEEKMAREFGRLIKQVGALLRSEMVPSGFADIAGEVVEAARAAHAKRNELVHDQWVHLPWTEDRIRSQRRPESKQFSDLRQCADDLREVMWRTRGAWIIAPLWFGRPEVADMQPSEVRSWTRVAMGHIDWNSPSQMTGTDGPAPMPPGW